MVVLILLAMIGVPVLEIAVFIEVGGAVGLARPSSPSSPRAGSASPC